jgi:hypothetical protein
MIAADPERELTPMLIRGRRGSITVVSEGELAPGLEGRLCRHVFADGSGSRRTTVVVTAVPEGMAFMPALVCRDRSEMGSDAPAQLPTESWTETELESTAFNSRYRLLTLRGQEPGYVRELFAPTLVAWLALDVPRGFSFELNEQHLVVGLPGHLDDAGAERLCALAAELTRRLREEAHEEGSGTGLFDESAELADIEAGLARVGFDQPPASVQVAIARFRRAASWRPTVLLQAIFWGVLGLVLGGIIVTFLSNPLLGIAAAAVGAWGGFNIGRLMAASRYRWGSASVSRLGLEAFIRGYAEARGLRLQDRWAFHSSHRHLPMPGFASHVMAGPIPGTNLDGFLVALGDAAEMRTQGAEIAYTTERPLAAIAVVAELAGEDAAADLAGREHEGGLQTARSGATVIVWRPFTGNLLFDAESFDRLRSDAGALLTPPR